MNCATCKVNKIGPKTAPFGGYLCSNEHMQCGDCNERTDGQCGICEECTSFVQMNFNQRVRNTSPIRRCYQMARPTPTAQSLDVESHSVAAATLETDSSYIFPKALYADMETQSSISQEQLSMHESHDGFSEDQGEEIHQHLIDADAMAAAMAAATMTQTPTPMTMSMSVPMSMNQYLPNAQERIQMETIYFGSNHQPQSASNFTFQFRTENGFMRLMQQRDSSGPALEVIEPPKSIQLTTEHTNLCDNSYDGGCDMAGTVDKGKGNNTATEDIEDVIHTSEIRFMDSTESMKNYFSGGTMHPILKSKHEPPRTSTTTYSHNLQPQESLSMKKLHDFETRNTAHPAELVESYLRNYGPLAFCQFPAYAFSHSCQAGTCDNRNQSFMQPPPQPQPPMQTQNQTRNVSASTESEPTLASAKKTELPPTKHLPPDYFVMQATGVATPAPGTLPDPDKIARPSIDIRMQKVLETFQEDPRTPNVSDKPIIDQSKKFLKIMDALEPAPVAAEPSLPLILEKHDDQLSSCELPVDKASLDIITQLSNTHRAFYNPPTDSRIIGTLNQTTNLLCKEPPPQFQLVTCSNIMAAELLLSKGRFINMKPLPACHLTIPRPPIKCPESSCQRMIFVSDFNKHLIVDHSMLPMERIAPRQCKNFFLDPKLAHCGTSKCHLLYLIRDKVTDLGSSKFKDFLPLLVMSTRIRLSDLCGIDAREFAKSEQSVINPEYLMIWLTGIVPEEFPVTTSLTVWSRAGQIPACHMVHSGEMYSLRKSQEIRDVCRSGQMVLLSSSEVHLLTNAGKEMLELQIVVH
uniref:Mucin-16 n=1 Tax=Zeugodacus cucurbitae TaxID=28588 RepID=A0A0A1XSD3_ZEUCU